MLPKQGEPERRAQFPCTHREGSDESPFATDVENLEVEDRIPITFPPNNGGRQDIKCRENSVGQRVFFVTHRGTHARSKILKILVTENPMPHFLKSF